MQCSFSVTRISKWLQISLNKYIASSLQIDAMQWYLCLQKYWILFYCPKWKVFISHVGFSPWTAYGACSENCGGGTHSRSRQCLIQTCNGHTEEIKNCNEQACQCAFTRMFWSINWVISVKLFRSRFLHRFRSILRRPQKSWWMWDSTNSTGFLV